MGLGLWYGTVEAAHAEGEEGEEGRRGAGRGESAREVRGGEDGHR